MSENHKNTLKTAWNDVTGDTINNSLKSDNKKYADGWDAIFGKKKEEPLEHAYEVTPEVVDGREQLHPYTLCPATGNSVYSVADILADPEHEGHSALKELMELLEKGEIHPS